MFLFQHAQQLQAFQSKQFCQIVLEYFDNPEKQYPPDLELVPQYNVV